MEMPSVELPEASLSWNSILVAVAVLVAIAGIAVALYKGWEVYKKVSLRDRVKDLESRMSSVEGRLALGDTRFQNQSDDLGQVLITMHAIMMHMISGNDRDKLQETEKELTKYMAHRKTRDGGRQE